MGFFLIFSLYSIIYRISCHVDLTKDNLMGGPIFFISDTHFRYHNIGEKEIIKKERFFKFLKEIRGASRLYLVGDIFDFWFEYKSSIPKYYWDVLCNLRMLRGNGTSIHITGGNHDYWLGPFIANEMGFEILPNISTHKLQGRTVTITHGDTLMPGDRKYKILKRVIGNPLIITLAKMIHPDILFRFAGWFSSASKEVTEENTEAWAKRLVGLAEDSFFKWDNDSFVMGHIHKPLIKHFGNQTFAILGDWERHFSYLRLENGVFSAGNYNEEVNTLIENR